jgi:hypothetical protein
MALLEPKTIPLNDTKVADQLIANEILTQAGLQQIAAPRSEVVQVMEAMGWSVREDLEDLRNLKRFAENESTRLQALRTSLELRELLGSKKKEEEVNKGVTFVIQGGNFQLNSILNPER